MAITPLDAGSEWRNARDLAGTNLRRYSLSAVGNAEFIDVGEQVLAAAWQGATVVDRASTTIAGSVVAIFEDEATTVSGTLYVWSRGFSG